MNRQWVLVFAIVFVFYQGYGLPSLLINFDGTGSLFTNEAGESAVFLVRLSEQPLSIVNIRVESSNNTAGVVYPPDFQFAPVNWNKSKSVIVTGRNDTNNGQGITTYGVDLTSSSTDPAWTNVRAFVPVINQHLFWPIVSSFIRENVSGIEVMKVVGSNFHNFTATYGRQTVEILQPSSNTFSFIPTTIDTTGKRPLKIVNSRGGFIIVTESQFYPKPDIDCDEDAICPEEGKMWPKEGFWNTGQYSGWVEECGPKSTYRCKGGEYSECHEGYLGDYCSICKEDYFEMNEACTDCEHRGVIAVYWIINLTVWGAFIAAAWFCPSFIWNLAGLLIPIVQLLRISAQMADYDIPIALRYIYSYLSILTVDVEFLHLGCLIDNMKWQHTFYINWLVILIIPIIAIGPVELWRLLRMKIFNPDMSDIEDMFNGRMVRISLIWCITVYWTVAILCFKTIFCIETELGWVMYYERSQRCDDPDQIIIIIVSAFVMAGFLLGLPIGLAVLFIIFRKKMFDDEWLDHFAPWYGSVKSIFFILWTNGILLLFLFLALMNVFTTKIAQFILVSLFLTGGFIIVVIFLPFDRLWKNIVVASGFAMAVLLALLGEVTSDDQREDEMKTAGTVIMWIMLPLIMLGAVIAIIVKIIYEKKVKDEDDPFQGYFMKEIEREM